MILSCVDNANAQSYNVKVMTVSWGGFEVKKRKYYSMSFAIKIILLIIVVPSIGALLYVNLQMRNALREQAAAVNGDMLDFYMEQMNETLGDVDIYLAGTLYNNQNIVELQLETDVNERQLIKYALHSDLVDSTVNQPKMDGFFVYSCPRLVKDDFFNCVNTNQISSSSALSGDWIFAKLVEAVASGELDTTGWFRWKMGDEYYLFRIVHDRNTYLGCWVGLNSLIQPMEKINFGEEGFAVLTSEDGQILTENPEDLAVFSDANDPLKASGSYLRVSAYSPRAGLNLVAMIPEENVLGGYLQVQTVLFVLSFIIIILLPLAAFLVSRFIYRPLNHLKNTMELVKQGNMDTRVVETSRLIEFYVLGSRFNEMLDEIHNMKVQMYERQLKEKETYLQYLQLQIHPHFFLNCMSLMHGLAQLEKYKDIQRLSKYLVRYFRYMFKKATSLITVREESDHIKNYMEIQNIRFPEHIQWQLDIDEDAMDVLLPPLSVQTFVENSVKYAMDLTRETRILVSVKLLGLVLKVSVKDNGSGYPIDVLTVINSKTEDFIRDNDENDTHRIGIHNVKERLKLIFGEESYIHFYNDKGSVVEYVIPVRRREEK